MSEYENKGDICVKLTRKNCKKVLGILEMFGERIWKHSELKEGRYDYYPVFAMMQNGEWLVNLVDTGKALVKPRQLRNILAKEHLKEGQIIIARINTGNGPVDFVTSFNYFHETGLSGKNWVCLDNDTPAITTGIGCFDNFLRYATDEEKALLEPKKVKSVKWTPDPNKGFASEYPKNRIVTKEVWVNIFPNGVKAHDKEEAALFAASLSNDVATVKGTLTYQIEKK